MPSGLKHGRMGLRAEENLFEGIRAGLKADGFRLQAGSSGLKPEGFGFKPGSQLLEGKLQTLECEEDRMQPEEVGLEAEWELFPWEGFGSEAGTMRRDRQGAPDLLLRGPERRVGGVLPELPHLAAQGAQVGHQLHEHRLEIGRAHV